MEGFVFIALISIQLCLMELYVSETVHRCSMLIVWVCAM